MFEGFANVWTPVVPSRSLQGKPLSVKLAGEPLVLFRDGRGRVGVLLDRCPHRGVSLSLGEVDEDGCLSCPFHGWSFRADGSCAHIPLSGLSGAKLERYAATAVPAREVGGLLWVFTGKDPAGTEPEPAPALVDAAWNTHFFSEVWGTHWTRALENMLDAPHVPFVHRRTIGRPMRAKMKRDSVLRMSIQPEPWGAVFPAEMQGFPLAMLAWRRPNGMESHIPIPGKGSLRNHIFCVPVDAVHTRIIVGVSRDFDSNNALTKLIDPLYRRILVRIFVAAGLEDRTVVESAKPAEVPPAGEELSVATDGPTLHFRRYYDRELRGSSAGLVPASRLAGGASSSERISGEVPLAAGAKRG